MPADERRDDEKMYHKMTISELETKYPNVRRGALSCKNIDQHMTVTCQSREIEQSWREFWFDFIIHFFGFIRTVLVIKINYLHLQFPWLNYFEVSLGRNDLNISVNSSTPVINRNPDFVQKIVNKLGMEDKKLAFRRPNIFVLFCKCLCLKFKELLIWFQNDTKLCRLAGSENDEWSIALTCAGYLWKIQRGKTLQN